MHICGRLVQFIWWWSRPRWIIYKYPEWDMREINPNKPGHYWTALDIGVVEVRVWEKGWTNL